MKVKSLVRNVLLILAGIAIAVVVTALVGMRAASESSVGQASAGLAVTRNKLAAVPTMAPSVAYEAYDMVAHAYEGGATTAAGEPGGERVIKNADLEMQVDDATVAVEDAKALASAKEGFVLSASVMGTERGERTAYVTLRVPVAEFESTVAGMKNLGTLLVSERSSGQDVTEEYADLESQIRNAKAEEEQYQQIMKQATKIQDILDVTSRLADVRGRIERLEGRRQYLANRTDYSTVSATMTEEPVVTAPTSKWRPLQVANEALKFLVLAFEAVVNLLIVIVIVGGGLLLPILLLVWIAYLLIRRAIGRFLK